MVIGFPRRTTDGITRTARAAAVALVGTLIVPAAHPRAAQPSSGDLETAARQAEQAGRLQDAFDLYVLAVQALPDPPPVPDDARLRGGLITVALRLQPRPVPEDADRAAAGGRIEFQEAKDEGGFRRGETQFRRAVRLAPWVPEFALNLALVQEKLAEYQAAAANLRLYLSARPPDAARIQQKLFELEYRGERALEAERRQAEASRPATVYFVREKQAASMGNMFVYCDEQPLARVRNGTYFGARIAPGKHTFAVDPDRITHSPDVAHGLEVDLQPGGEYYIRMTFAGGWLSVGHFNLTLIPNEAVAPVLATLKSIAQDSIQDSRAFVPSSVASPPRDEELERDRDDFVEPPDALGPQSFNPLL